MRMGYGRRATGYGQKRVFLGASVLFLAVARRPSPVAIFIAENPR